MLIHNLYYMLKKIELQIRAQLEHLFGVPVRLEVCGVGDEPYIDIGIEILGSSGLPLYLGENIWRFHQLGDGNIIEVSVNRSWCSLPECQGVFQDDVKARLRKRATENLADLKKTLANKRQEQVAIQHSIEDMQEELEDLEVFFQRNWGANQDGA